MKAKGFYWYFRPIALSAKLFGVLPLQNLHYADGSKIYFRYVSIAHLYSTVMFFSVLTLFGYYTSFKFGDPENLHLESVTDYWKILVMYIMLIRSSLCFLFCIRHSKKLPSLIKILELYEKQKYKMLNTKENVIKQLFLRCVFPYLNGSFYVIASFYEVKSFVKQVLHPNVHSTENSQKASIIFGILGDWQVLPLLIYLYFASRIKFNFEEISNALLVHAKMDDMGNDEFRSDPDLSQILQNSRRMHILMSTAVNEVNNCYGSFMAVDQLCTNIMFVINLYVYFVISNNDIHLLLCTIISGILILAVIMWSHSIKEAAINILDPLQKISLSAIDDKSKMEIQLFMNQLASRPIEVSAAGYFTMDRTQIPSICSSVSTCFIMILQFQIQPGSLTNLEKSY